MEDSILCLNDVSCIVRYLNSKGEVTCRTGENYNTRLSDTLFDIIRQKMEVCQMKFNKVLLARYIATFALVCSIVGANSRCCYIFHQPEKPDMRKLRRY